MSTRGTRTSAQPTLVPAIHPSAARISANSLPLIFRIESADLPKCQRTLSCSLVDQRPFGKAEVAFKTAHAAQYSGGPATGRASGGPLPHHSETMEIFIEITRVCVQCWRLT